ncbi:protein kinase domain containing protein [Stylonychia lemnae]|uniref:Protein kinase domain containing protein n=1 Tax=Stylonychia lemnae TaxID=5949 RepID=A0A078ALP1_STYLE|nr:protein kinase domain containing protein [Stylonychia lemnae]|eukprot:CDW83270.1 protein kinase domain containing protein [Stylonychia lemnae]
MEKANLPCIDVVNVKSMPDIMTELANEQLVYSNRVKKFNRFDWTQERIMIITNKRILNIKKQKIQRAIAIEKLVGVTKSVSEPTGEFVLHIKDEYDYRMRSDSRDQIIDIIRKLYQIKTVKNLAFYGVKPKALSEFTTSKKDLKKGLSRIPLEMARIKEENESEINFNIGDDDTEDFSNQMDERTSSYHQNSIPNFQIDKECSEILQGREKSSTLYSKRRDQETSLDDFTVKKVIGQGSFGKVFMVIHNSSGNIYAMKSIRKDVVIDSEQLENLRLEKHIMLCVEHPFIISMEYVFQRDFRIYFLMDFIKGGELYRQLALNKRLTEFHAKFYAAQVALALGYLHKSRIIYRDLKPENILINKDGYIKLADFGLAKMLGEQVANSFCGTPEYLCKHSFLNIFQAPEMINGSGHDHSLDWWTLGILIYEMIIGIPPFYNQNKHQMYYLIENGPIRWPSIDKHGFEVSSESQDLINKLLDKDKSKRLGKVNGVDDILSHPWFKELGSMEDLLQKKITAPYIPVIKQEDDTSNFDEKFQQLEVVESIIDQTKQQLIEQHKDDFETF